QLEAELDDVTLVMWVDREWVTVNGARQDLAGGLQTLNGAPYVHGPETARLLGLDTRWDPAALTLATTRTRMMPEGTPVAATLLEVREPASLLVRVNETQEISELPMAADPVVQRSEAEEDPGPASLTDLQPGDLLEIVLNEEAEVIGVRATYAQALGTIASIQGNELTLQGGQTHPLGARVQAVGSDGRPLHLLSAVGQGAILTLNPSTNAVWRILAQRRGTTTPPETAQPVIAAFTVTGYDRPLGQGDALQIRIVGTAGATATVQLGAAGPTVTVPEDDPGVYHGSMDIEADLLISDEHLLAQLETPDANSQTVRSNRAVTVDGQPPVLEEPLPRDGATIADANTHIGISFHDGDGVGVDPNTATLSVDGADVTGDAQVQPDGLLYDTPEPLAAGGHSASASVTDALGNTATRTWNWTIGEADRGIQTVSHDADDPLNPGDTLTVTMEATAPGQAARFSIDGVADDIAMTQVGETSTYEGSYTVRQGDATAGATVSAVFRAADGTEYEANAPAQVIITAPEVPFAITTPAEDEEAGRRIRPAGTAPPGSTVRWTISYREFILSGNVNTGTVEADGAGNWQTAEEVDLKLLLVGMADTYTLKAELLDDEGAVQQTKSVRFEADD
ncbi:MAG: hypothetical protein ACOCX2_13055, partial [Armatimonadota bacterium]